MKAKINRNIIILVFVTTNISCSTSKYSQSYYLKPNVESQDKFLFSEVGGVDSNMSMDLFEEFQRRVSKCNEVEYVPYVDYDFRAQGVDPNDFIDNPETSAKASVITNARYIISVDILGISSKYNAASDITIPYQPGTLYFEVRDLTDPYFKWGFGIETAISGSASTNRLQGVSPGLVAINSAVAIRTILSSEQRLAVDGFDKGIRRFKNELLVDCGGED
ncbi:MAG: hypothetical protein RIF46_08465 [Cyclobacteriaceae bacterium]